MAVEDAFDVTVKASSHLELASTTGTCGLRMAQQSLHVALTKACLATPVGTAELSSALADSTGSRSNAVLLILYFHPALATQQTSELNHT